MVKKYMLLIILSFTISCTDSEPTTIIHVVETTGINRDLEYVALEIPIKRQVEKSKMWIVTDMESKISLPVQIVETLQKEGQIALKAVFPVNIKANETKHFQFGLMEKMRDAPEDYLLITKDGQSVENQHYKATFSPDDKRGGQINGLVLREFNDQILKRNHNSMHWAPNFSSTTTQGYFNMDDMTPDSEHVISNGIYSALKKRSGVTDSVPEIHTTGTYTFYKDLPYFLFSSTMTVKNEVELDLLRNDEMTMDSLFTHVMYQKKDGEVSHLKLYDTELDILEENPIPEDAPWLAFYNLDRGYGFGSIRLEYDNTNTDGKPSPTFKPYTKISKGSNAGRYWNRILIADTNVTVSKGSRYHEKNAYVIFRVDSLLPEKEFLAVAERLKNPLSVSIKE